MLRDIPWETAFLLGAIGLMHPLLSMAGGFDPIDSAGSILISIVIAVLWIGLAVYLRVSKPVAALAAAGAAYALLSVLLLATVQVFFPGAGLEAPVSLPALLTVGLAGSLVTNMIWGAFLGLASQAIMGKGKGKR